MVFLSAERISLLPGNKEFAVFFPSNSESPAHFYKGILLQNSGVQRAKASLQLPSSTPALTCALLFLLGSSDVDAAALASMSEHGLECKGCFRECGWTVL